MLFDCVDKRISARYHFETMRIHLSTNPIASVVGRRASRIFETLFDRRQDDAAKALLADLTAALDRAERSALGSHECAECCGNVKRHEMAVAKGGAQ